MALQSWEFGDPFEVAARREAHEQRQAAACGACIHHVQVVINGKTLHACDIRRHFGKRCDQYKTKPKGKP
mgnify:FL=1